MENNTIDYGQEGVVWHAYSPRLMQKIIELFPKETPVVDMGCGLNNYVNILCYLGYSATGIDYTNLGSKNFIHADLTKPVKVKYKRANVISMEIGEHIEPEGAYTYLDNVTSLGGDIIFSWAVPGQEGIGHINCRDNYWVREEMAKRGYMELRDKSNELRAAIQDCHCTWFRETLLYFTRVSPDFRPEP